MPISARHSTLALAASALLAGASVFAQAANPVAEVGRILASPAFKTAAATIDKEHGRIVEDGIKLTEIPAPPFKEEARAKAFEQMLKAVGLADVKIDEEGNVLGACARERAVMASSSSPPPTSTPSSRPAPM